MRLLIKGAIFLDIVSKPFINIHRLTDQVYIYKYRKFICFDNYNYNLRRIKTIKVCFLK